MGCVQARRKWQQNEYSQIPALFGQHHVSRTAGARFNGSILRNHPPLMLLANSRAGMNSTAPGHPRSWRRMGVCQPRRQLRVVAREPDDDVPKRSRLIEIATLLVVGMAQPAGVKPEINWVGGVRSRHELAAELLDLVCQFTIPREAGRERQQPVAIACPGGHGVSRCIAKIRQWHAAGGRRFPSPQCPGRRRLPGRWPSSSRCAWPPGPRAGQQPPGSAAAARPAGSCGASDPSRRDARSTSPPTGSASSSTS